MHFHTFHIRSFTNSDTRNNQKKNLYSYCNLDTQVTATTVNKCSIFFVSFLPQVYIGELEVDLCVCHRRNTHNHSKEYITRIVEGWERTPPSYTKVDLTSLSQDAAIEEVRRGVQGGGGAEAVSGGVKGRWWWTVKDY